MEFFHSEQKGERTQSAPSSLQCAEQLQSHSAKSIQTQSRSAPQKGITSPYRSNYITYKPNKRAQADLSAHRPDGLRLRGGKRQLQFLYTTRYGICQAINFQNVVSHQAAADFHNAYCVHIPCVSSVHDFGKVVLLPYKWCIDGTLEFSPI